MKIYYNRYLKQFARKLRNESTQSEIKLWGYLRNKQIYGYRFTRQKPIGKYIMDFFCNKLQLAIELDGYSHQFDDVFEKDKRKEEQLKKIGITVLRFQDTEVMNDMDNVLRSIEIFIENFEAKSKHHQQSPP